jgi:hypothetical protein
MRHSETWVVLLGAATSISLSACAVPIGDDGDAGAVADASASPPPAPGCLAFTGVAGLASVTGAMRSIPGPSGNTLFVVDSARVGGTMVANATLRAPASASIDDCLASANPAGEGVSPALPSSDSALSGLAVGPATWLFFSQGAGDGLAMLGGAGGAPLWTSDRPAYGTAAVQTGGQVYVFGCLPARFLDADCYVARAAPASITDEAAYAYYVGGGLWSPRIDDAWPTTSAGTSMDVAWVPSASRWIMVYAPPLGSTLVARSGLAPEGPWSAPIQLATCVLADSDMFCTGVHLHPSLTRPGFVVLSYAAASLSSDVAARRVSEPTKWWPRLAAVALPSLP